jgi:hypothetical protein
MKNKTFQYFGILIAVFFATGCQNFDEPAFGDYPLDPPIITLNSPNAGGSTVLRSSDPTAPITLNFQVEDDIEISNITVNVDGIDLTNMSEFTNVKKVLVDDLVYDASTGTHTLTITATDSDDNVVTLSTTFVKEDTPPYNPTFAGEIFYMDFEGSYTDLASNIGATEVGTPGFAGEGRVGSDAYAGATDSYLTFPTNGLLGSEFSASFWYKVNADPTAAGILVIGPPDDSNPSAPNNRKSGFRFFREGGATNQTFKLNVGNGTADSWFDGGPAATINPAESADWIHFAFTISNTECVVYMNGEVVKQGPFSGVAWDGCDIMSIMSGAPRFTEWGHKSDLSYIDELRLFDVALTQSDVTNIIAQTDKTFDMSFDGSLTESVSQTDATAVGTPGFSGEAKKGSNAYAGATGSYLTFPTTGLTGESFSGVMWYKVNATPDRAGILTIGPPDVDNAGFPDIQNKRTSGFRLFREGNATEQRIKLNVGTGAADNWNDGGVIDVTAGEWVHVAFTISATQTIIYLNGVAFPAALPGPTDWTGCDLLSVMSGAPRFTEWGHKSDVSYMDELHLFNKVLTKAEIYIMMAE